MPMPEELLKRPSAADRIAFLGYVAELLKAIESPPPAMVSGMTTREKARFVRAGCAVVAGFVSFMPPNTFAPSEIVGLLSDWATKAGIDLPEARVLGFVKDIMWVIDYDA